MRINQPVSGREYPYPSGASLVSTTDLQGRITYCNPAFIEVSGYSRDELLGQPHNLIRHPDMPAEAFRDLWATIASGQPWSGVVVNRRKDGDHYWVLANVTPLVEDGRVAGYMSVRTCPDRASVDAAVQLYARMRAEAQGGRLAHRLCQGEVQRAGTAARWRQRLRIDLRGQLALASLGVALASWGAAMTAGAYGLIGALLAAGLVGWLLQRHMVAPLQRLLLMLHAVGGGDLRQAATSSRTDLVGRLIRSLNQVNVNLASVVGDARSETVAMHASLREIASGNHDLSARTESQAASLQETAASMDQITGTVRQTSASADRAAVLARQAHEVTAAGCSTMHELASAMEAIRAASDRIAEINGVIDGIAFQTNILALNAAVEAARAGEQGRGFAVVAGEVRALATRTSTAAREVRSLIDQAASQVQAGQRLSLEAQRSLDVSVEASREVGTLVDEINGASREQLVGISQVNDAVAALDTITQQNAALVEQVTASTQSLQGQAQALVDSVQVFRVMGRPDSTPPVDAVQLRRQARERRAATTATPA